MLNQNVHPWFPLAKFSFWPPHLSFGCISHLAVFRPDAKNKQAKRDVPWWRAIMTMLLDHYRPMTVLDVLALSPSYGYGLSLSTPRVCVCSFRKEEREQGEHKTATYSPRGGKREREAKTLWSHQKPPSTPASFFLLNIMIMNYGSISYLITLSTHLHTLPGVICFLFSPILPTNEMITAPDETSTLLKRYEEVNKKTTAKIRKE